MITPVVNPAAQYGYLIGSDQSGNSSATIVDLRPGSQTFGQLLPATEVVLTNYFPSAFNLAGDAISSDGVRVVVAGFNPQFTGPQPNAVVVDTGLMLTDPSQAVVGHSTAAGGAQPAGVAIGAVTTSPLPTAPTVTGVSGNITNNAPATIHIYGTNFASGALVRIGKMAQLPTTVNSSTDLQVTVPVNAPAAPKLDVIVTNPESTSPPAQQNQSGLLAGGLTINVNPAFQPAYQFAVSDGFVGDGNLSVFQYAQDAMVQVALSDPVRPAGITFNLAGGDLYTPSMGPPYLSEAPGAVALNLSTLQVDSFIPTSDFLGGVYTGLTSAINPQTGSPVIDMWTSGVSSGGFDVAVNMIDANPSSPTFNHVTQTLYAGLNNSDLYITYSGAATPDGRYVYVNFQDLITGESAIAIFDVVNGGPATIVDNSSLGAFGTQLCMYVTPDGQSLLLNALNSSGALGPIGVYDIGSNPKNPTLVTTLNGPLGGSLFYSYQVADNRLFAIDLAHDIVVAFNFDRTHNKFNLLGAYVVAGDFTNTYIAVSPDGNLLYVPVPYDDVVAVLDANKLAAGQPPLLTNLASFGGPTAAAVDPMHH